MQYKDQFISQKVDQLIYASQINSLQSFFKDLESEFSLDYLELYKARILEFFIDEVKEEGLITKLCDHLIYNNILPSVTQILNTTKINNCLYITNYNKIHQNQIRQYGKDLHEFISLFLKGFSVDKIPEYLEPWWNPVKPLVTDIRAITDPEFIEKAAVYSKVEFDSENPFILSYVGRVDCVGAFQGKKYLIDWKFSSSSFDQVKLAEAYLQCSAYCLALKQSFDLDLDGFKIIGVEPNKNPKIWTVESNSIDFYLTQWIARLKKFLRPGQRIKCSNNLSFRVLTYPKTIRSGKKTIVCYQADQFLLDQQYQNISRINDIELDENLFEYETLTNDSCSLTASEDLLRFLGVYSQGRIIQPYFLDDEAPQYDGWFYKDDILNSYLESSYYFGCSGNISSLKSDSNNIHDLTNHEYQDYDFHDDVEVLLDCANSYFDDGDFKNSLLASAIFLKRNKNSESNFIAYKLRAEIFYHLEMFYECIDNYTNAIKIKNDVADLYNKRSSAYIKIGMFQQAQSDLDNALILLR